MIKEKYSKSSTFYKKTKRSFFSNNDSLLRDAIKKNKLYSNQPRREKCKICSCTLPNNFDFISHHVEYVFCTNCNHLNGAFDDTNKFVDELYLSNFGEDYSKNYLDENFIERAEDIYMPKLDFLMETIKIDNHKRILDVGCGCGYFVFCAIKRNVSATGIDLNESMVSFGNNQINNHFSKSPLTTVDESSLFSHIKDSDADVISAIGVLEHIRNPREFFESFKLSNARYIYYSVPMFSLSVIIENVFKDIYPRHLSGGHTHLFTEKSIETMNNFLDVAPIGIWRFGTDVMDLYRHLLVSLQLNNSSKKIIDYFHDGFSDRIDEIQSIFDLNHFCSEIHVIAKKKVHPGKSGKVE